MKIHEIFSAMLTAKTKKILYGYIYTICIISESSLCSITKFCVHNLCIVSVILLYIKLNMTKKLQIPLERWNV